MAKLLSENCLKISKKELKKNNLDEFKTKVEKHIFKLSHSKKEKKVENAQKCRTDSHKNEIIEEPRLHKSLFDVRD